MKTKYYAIAGVNGYGVYDEYEKALMQKTYLAEFKIKRCHSFDEAKGWAEELYIDLQDGISIGTNIDDINKLNWTFYRNK